MNKARELQTKRLTARIPGHTVASKTRMSRSRLSDIENGLLAVAPEELVRIEAAIDEIADERRQLAALAEEHGLDIAAVGLQCR